MEKEQLEKMELQERITHGWEVSAEGYSKRVVKDDFETPGREVWQNLILSKAPREGALDILDVGTGPGVFATILAMKGHNTTGIDISPKMLEEAKANSSRMGVFPNFLLMNSQDVTFPENSFDIIVSRNVVWTIKDPEQAYAKWLKCLKPGGRLIVFDGKHNKTGDWARDFTKDNKREEIRQAYFEKFGEMPPCSFDNYEEARGFKKDLKLTYEDRPDWDVETLNSLGYLDVAWDDVSEESNYNEKRKFLQSHGSGFGGLFRLWASKPE